MDERRHRVYHVTIPVTVFVREDATKKAVIEEARASVMRFMDRYPPNVWLHNTDMTVVDPQRDKEI